MRVRRAAERRRPRWYATHDLVPEQVRACRVGAVEHEVAFVDPSSVVLDVGLIEDRNTIVGNGPACQRDGLHEPRPPTIDTERRQLAVIRQRRDDRVIGRQAIREKRDAVALRISVLGESAHKVDKVTEAALPGVPFKSIRGMRNRIAHDYGAVDFRIVWTVTQEEIEPLIAALSAYFAERLKPEKPH